MSLGGRVLPARVMAGNDQVIRPNSEDETSDLEMYMSERAPSDPAIRGLFQLLDHKFNEGADVESLQADYILPNFIPGNITLQDYPRARFL